MFALRHVFYAKLKPSKTRADKFQCQKHANLHTRNQNNHTKVAHGLKQRNLFRSPKVACPLNSRLGGLGLAILRPEALGWLASWASQQFSPEWKVPIIDAPALSTVRASAWESRRRRPRNGSDPWKIWRSPKSSAVAGAQTRGETGSAR